MKKTLALLLTLALSMAALTGCGSKTDAPAADSTDSTTGTETPAALSGSVPVKTTPKPIYVMLNKPRGYVTTVSDEQGRKTVMDLLRGIAGRIYPVGRLDMDSEGLLLLTNDGVLAQGLLHPSHEVSKEYHVTVSGALENAAERLARVRDVGGLPIRPAQVRLLRQDEGQAVFSIVIHEGRNRQIRRMCAQCGLKVQRLQRVREQQLRLGDLPLGKWRYLTEREVADLKNRA